MKRAVYPGTFDPITNGHVDIIRRTLRIFDKVVIAVAPNPKKTPLFDLKERIFMIEEATRGMKNIEIEPFEGLLVDYVKERGADAIIRGLRAVSDFEYELQMALMNRKLSDTIETVFLMPSEEYSYLTSSIVKEVASYGGEVKDLVPSIVARRLSELFKRRD
ncbi:MAG: pantetheine-phosphate adenylyltransferase [Nitrospirae bacterium]|nr:pantetheine-phosphate adenylyltransferase [Nitrospirota bacterium]